MRCDHHAHVWSLSFFSPQLKGYCRTSGHETRLPFLFLVFSKPRRAQPFHSFIRHIARCWSREGQFFNTSNCYFTLQYIFAAVAPLIQHEHIAKPGLVSVCPTVVFAAVRWWHVTTAARTRKFRMSSSGRGKGLAGLSRSTPVLVGSQNCSCPRQSRPRPFPVMGRAAVLRDRPCLCASLDISVRY